MYIHNINPTAISIGPLDIRFYGLVYFIGFLFIYFFLRYQIRKNKIPHLNYNELDNFMIYFMLGSIIGARVLDFVFFNTNTLLTNPQQVLRIWEGGMSIHGGIIGAIIAGLIYVHKRKVKFYDIADQVIIPLMFFLGIGRIANFINAELWGTEFYGKYCINYEQNTYIHNAPKGCTHPYQIYESIKNFTVSLGLFILSITTKLKKGTLFWIGILAYNTLRFFIDFYRDETKYLSLGMGQYLSIAFTIIAIIFLIQIHINKEEPKKNETNKKNKTKQKRK